MGKKAENNYNIRQVIDLTGVSEFVLRAWENRYAAFEPSRTSSGRRRYSSDDIVKARLLLKLTEKGHRISSIAHLNPASLQALSEQRELKKRAPSEDADDIATVMKWADQYKWDLTREMMSEKHKKLKARAYIFQFILPLISEISHQVALGQLSVAQEHILSAFIKEDLMLLKTKKNSNKKPLTRLVFATPEGDQHEIGLLIASVLAHLAGVSTLYLGPNVPARELCEASERFKATHLLVVATVEKMEGAKMEVLQFINFLDKHLPTSINLWTAGRSSPLPDLALRRNFKLIENFQAFESLVNKEHP